LKTTILFDGPLVPRRAPGRFAPLSSSAFRALGLRATATQREVFDAATSLRLALKVGVGRQFPTDLAWLGPVQRAEPDLRDALGRLSSPAERARERLFWFHERVEAARPASVAELEAVADGLLAAPEDAGGPGRHDAALLLLAGLHYLDPTLAEAAAWQRAFRLWREVCDDEAFWSLLVAADLKGGFEPAVTFGEVSALRAEAPRFATTAAARFATAAAVTGHVGDARRALSVLRAASLPAPLLAEYEGETIGPFEDRCDERLDEAFSMAELFYGPEAISQTKRRYFGQALADIEAGLKPALRDLLEVAGGGSPAVRRAFAESARRLLRLAEGYDGISRRAETAAALRALAHAITPPADPEDETTKAAEVESPREYEARALCELRRAMPEWLAEADHALAHAGEGKGSGAVGVFVFYGLVVVSCFLLHWTGVIKTSPRPPAVGSLMNYNFPVVAPTVSMPPDLRALRLTPRISAGELRELLRRKRAVVVDVRDRAEFDAGHLPGAVWMPAAEVEKKYRRLLRGRRRVVFYCDCPDEEAAERAAVKLWIQSGAEVAVLKGGYAAWLAETGALPPPTRTMKAPPLETTVAPPTVKDR
jgi:rhodanese-related sulfurtransferase